MKTFKLGLLAFVVSVVLLSFSIIKSGSIKGTISPAGSVLTAWASSGSDTLKAIVTNGIFEIPDAKPGTYKVVIEAMPPFKTEVKENIMVADGQTTDLGEIKLEKQ